MKLNGVYNCHLLTLRLNLKSQCTVTNSISSGQWIVNSFFKLFPTLIFAVVGWVERHFAKSREPALHRDF